MITPFQTGDVVKYIGKGTWKKDAIHIIHECDYLGKGQFQYSTNRGAWFDTEDFVLIRKADKQSFKDLDKYLKEEDEENYE